MDPLAYPERRGKLAAPRMGPVSSRELLPVLGGM
jgi:hypothetical protein